MTANGVNALIERSLSRRFGIRANSLTQIGDRLLYFPKFGITTVSVVSVVSILRLDLNGADLADLNDAIAFYDRLFDATQTSQGQSLGNRIASQ